MNHYWKMIRTVLGEQFCNYGDSSVHSLLEMLYLHFTELNPINSDETQALCNALDPYLGKLSEAEIDSVFILVNDLCVQHEKAAFLKGMQAGASLMLELLTHP